MMKVDINKTMFLAISMLVASGLKAKADNVTLFSTALSEAKTERATEAYPDSANFDKAIVRATDFLARLQANPSLRITLELNNLYAAREAYYNSQYPETAIQQTVSEVDLSLNGSEKYVLRVDGKPYYPIEIQVRPDKMRGYCGWSEDEVEATFRRAAEDGFKTLSIPVYWKEVEPEKNHFDWHMLDKYMGWCEKYGMKMEMLWFSWSSGGRIQYLWNWNDRKVLRTPDYVCSLDGTSDYNMLRKEWEYSLDWRDNKLCARENFVLGKVMEHIALWDANHKNNHVVIGVQLGNEARAHGANTATSAEIIDYYSQVGEAVKSSKYVTWTRLNCVSYETSGRTTANENKRKAGGTNIDYVGIDVYGTSAGSVKGNLNGQLGTNGKNYRMIMEIDAKDANSPFYQMAALAGDKAFDYYNLGPVDGNGLYDANWEAHQLIQRSHIEYVRQRNRLLSMANQDIALYKQGGGLYVYNYAASSKSEETGLEGITFTPNETTTQALAVRHGNDGIVLLSTDRGAFTLPSQLLEYKAQSGYFDENNQWMAQKNLTIRNKKVQMLRNTCVLLTKNPGELTGIEPTATYQGTKKAVEYYSLSGQKIDSPTQGVYIVKYNDGTRAKVYF